MGWLTILLVVSEDPLFYTYRLPNCTLLSNCKNIKLESNFMYDVGHEPVPWISILKCSS